MYKSNILSNYYTRHSHSQLTATLDAATNKQSIADYIKSARHLGLENEPFETLEGCNMILD